MKEKELRLAIVFFGGVSLAVYQHGINREILNLVRASGFYHRTLEGGGSASAAFHDSYPDEPSRSTGSVYLQFLEKIGQHLSLRVIVDVISGASAGGMNGIALARALAHDLSLAPLTDMWLNDADMLKLLAPEAKAKLWNKWIFWPFVRPMLTRLHREGLIAGKIDEEMAERVSVFLRSRWFKPPLDGRRLATLVLDGLSAMEKPGGQRNSLLPPGTRLDLQVTATDYGGLDRPIFIHDPPVIKEREHRHIMRFRLEHDRAGHLQSDFDLDNVPSLAFAARASASYPGAFPPAQLGEMDDLLASRHQPWPARARFVANNFSGYREQGMHPEDAVLLDGSILDNKPIMATLEAIRTHSAYREVDRRLVYIDPHSRMDKPPPSSSVPGFFTTLRGALSDLPRTAPTYNELANVSRYNKQVRRLKETILHARSQVAKLLEQSTGGRLSGDFTLNELRHWRLISTNLLAGTPIVYDSYMRALVLEALDFVAVLISDACGFARESTASHRVQDAVEGWAVHQGILLADSYHMPDAAQENTDMPAFARMVIDFGLVYKRRRLHFVLHEINDLYGNDASATACSPVPEDLDLLKIQIHKLIDEMAMYDDSSFLSAQAVAMCRKLFPAEPGRLPGGIPVDTAALTALVKRLGIESDLARRLDDADAVLSSALVQNLAPHCRSAILASYLGYFYWDIILRPVVSALALEAGPIEEVLIDRISPDDALALAPPEATRMLLGGTFAGFGGFLSRATRENDYLWGRLHAVDRLFDILAATAAEAVPTPIDFPALKKAAFACVIEEEAARLTLIPDLVARIRAAIAAL
ncbi:patatin-like protein [Janthinobacterium sp. 17J80-10]|uniref:patatin-like protein n=1 Tax=Janthinobacterium sp. 17J80-10 TaxID=2497863 RepID=UPI0010056DEA|nr:patatin-like protein [Janthinobacterium sp. 17J80-10]QAU35732.1 patatin-like protein [Janthinobacterium sp. 17J80-10]